MKQGVTALFVIFGLVVYLFQADMGYALVSSTDGAISAPTGVAASDGDYSNKIGIHWDTIRGATLYRLYRNTSNTSTTATDVGTTAANYFFDMSPAVGQTYFYWVRAENGSAVSEVSASDQGTRAAGTIAPGPFAPLDPPIAPTGNPVTAAKSYLGKTLFWDEQMSATRTVACGTCHRPGEGGSDPRTSVNSLPSTNPGFDSVFSTTDDVHGSPGVPRNASTSGYYLPDPVFGFNEQVTGRKSPSYLNSGYSPNGLFWDGRAMDVFFDQLSNDIILMNRASLESQSAGPPVSSVEMGDQQRTWAQVASQIQASRPLALASNIPPSLSAWINDRTYAELFTEAFGSPDVTPARISMAIATHERTLFSDNSPLDRWAAQIQPLSAQEESGRSLFVNLQCNTCHDGALLSDHQFHNIGVRPQVEDLGRGGVTLNPNDDGKFRTPTLRNVELHAPYMHNGRFATLEDVVDFYDRGGDFDAPNIDHGVIRPLNLTLQQKSDLVVFMKRPLTDLRVKNELPPFDRPKLYTESANVPQITGSARSGSGGFTPQMKAISPPIVGNPQFTLGVHDAIGGSTAVLVIDEADPGVGTTIPATGSFLRVGVSTGGADPGNGFASFSVPIPDTQAFVGRTLYARWYVLDAGAVSGFSVSQAAKFTVFGVPTATTVTVSGRVLTPDGRGLRNAIVTMTDNSGASQTVTTSSFGIYQFVGIPPIGLQPLSFRVSSKRYRFGVLSLSTENDYLWDFVGLE